MIQDYLQIRNISIVLLGEFNPAIIQPFWLVDKKLIREIDAKEANIELIHNEVNKFDLKWVRFEITKERCQLQTSLESHFELVRDLVINIFEILKETPIFSLGINHEYHFAIERDDLYYRFGNNFAPLDNWNGFLNDPKVLNIEIIENNRKDGLNGRYRIKMQPSDLNLASQNKLLISINDHFTIDTAKGENGRKLEMIDTLKKVWKSSFERAEQVVNEIWDKTK